MHTFAIGRRRALLVTSIVLGFALLFGGFLSRGGANEQAAESATARPAQVFLSTSTLSFLVSGVVEASAHSVIYAETQGVVTTLRAREGATVSVGEQLLTQSTPVADARAALTEAERDLTTLTERQRVTESTARATQASHRAYAAADIATLRTAAQGHRIAGAAAALVVDVKQSILAAVDVLSFVNEHRYAFSAEGLDTFDAVAASLYGTVPNYFQGGVMPANRSAENLHTVLDVLEGTVAEGASVEDVLVLREAAARMLLELQTLEDVLKSAEADLLDYPSPNATDELQIAFASVRSGLLASEEALNTSYTSLVAVADTVLEEVVALKTDVAITNIDEALAARQATYAAETATQADRVATARLSVVEAERALARPYAPFSGTVSEVFVDIGEYVSAGTPLLVLVGDGARELSVNVPASLASHLSVGQPFLVDNVVAGHVERFSGVTEGQSVTAIVALSDTGLRVGTSITGVIEAAPVDGLFSVPRHYIHFDAVGAYVVYESGAETRVEVAYDTGDTLFVRVETVRDEALVPAVSMSL